MLAPLSVTGHRMEPLHGRSWASSCRASRGDLSSISSIVDIMTELSQSGRFPTGRPEGIAHCVRTDVAQQLGEVWRCRRRLRRLGCRRRPLLPLGLSLGHRGRSLEPSDVGHLPRPASSSICLNRRSMRQSPLFRRYGPWRCQLVHSRRFPVVEDTFWRHFPISNRYNVTTAVPQGF
jgi:hypothetical protein